MPNPALLEAFPTPAETPFLIEHVADEFTSLCPKTGHPDFGTITVRFQPRAAREGGLCVELKSLKLYLFGFRDRGIFYEAVTNRIRDDLVQGLSPHWLQVISDWHGRGGFRSRIIAVAGTVPEPWRRP